MFQEIISRLIGGDLDAQTAILALCAFMGAAFLVIELGSLVATAAAALWRNRTRAHRLALHLETVRFEAAEREADALMAQARQDVATMRAWAKQAKRATNS